MIRNIVHITPHTFCPIYGDKRNHHFLIDCDHSDYVDIKLWLTSKTSDSFDIFPEMIGGYDLPTTSTERIHVIIKSDRDAAIFKLSW